MPTLLILIIIFAFVFDYINGFHDSANSIATIVSTKVLTPFQAVVWAAFFNFAAFFISKYIVGGFGIADTIFQKRPYSNRRSAGTLCYFFRSARRHYLEPDHLVVWHPLQFFPCSHRRPDRWCCGPLQEFKRHQCL